MAGLVLTTNANRVFCPCSRPPICPRKLIKSRQESSHKDQKGKTIKEYIANLTQFDILKLPNSFGYPRPHPEQVDKMRKHKKNMPENIMKCQDQI